MDSSKPVVTRAGLCEVIGASTLPLQVKAMALVAVNTASDSDFQKFAAVAGEGLAMLERGDSEGFRALILAKAQEVGGSPAVLMATQMMERLGSEPKGKR